jgi:hypothetical protein
MTSVNTAVARKDDLKVVRHGKQHAAHRHADRGAQLRRHLNAASLALITRRNSVHRGPLRR